MITVGTPPANSEAIGEISHSLNVFLSNSEAIGEISHSLNVFLSNSEAIGEISHSLNVFLCVVKEEEDYSGTGYEEGQYSTTARFWFCDKKQTTKLLTFVSSFVRLQQLAKRSDRQESRYKRVAYF